MSQNSKCFFFVSRSRTGVLRSVPQGGPVAGALTLSHVPRLGQPLLLPRGCARPDRVSHGRAEKGQRRTRAENQPEDEDIQKHGQIH